MFFLLIMLIISVKHVFFFKPEHYGFYRFKDRLNHVHEWILSALRRYCYLDTGIGAVESKERVKYLDDDKMQLILLFFQKLEEPFETEEPIEGAESILMVHRPVDAKN